MVIEFLTVVIEIFYLGRGQKAYGGALTRQQPAARLWVSQNRLTPKFLCQRGVPGVWAYASEGRPSRSLQQTAVCIAIKKETTAIAALGERGALLQRL